MENKKLISARVDLQTLVNIENFANRYFYWKRNTVISHILDAVFDNFDNKTIYDMMRYDRHLHSHASGTFSLDDKK